MKKTLSHCSFVLLTAIVLLIGCKKKEMENPVNSSVSTPIPNPNTSDSKALQLISVESNYLVFNSPTHFKSTLNYLATLNESQKDLWELSFTNFKSMRKTYNDDMISDSIFANQYTTIAPSTPHSPQIMANMSMYYQYPVPDNGYLLLKNVSIERHSWLVNKQGLVKAGNSIYQFQRGILKIMTPANVNYVPALVSATVSNPTYNFKVITGDDTMDKASSCGYHSLYYNNNYWNTQGTVTFSTKGSLAIYMQVTYSAELDTNCISNYTPMIDASVQSTKRTWYGSWVRDNATMTYSQSYSTNFTIPINTTVAPAYGSNQSSGGNSVLNYHQEYYPVNTLAYSKMFVISNFSAYATRSGGSSGGSITEGH